MATHRYDRIDALRGLAVAWMTLFHFGFDLSHFGWWRQDFYRDPVWTVQRTLIVSLFLFCAGLGQAVAVSQGQSLRRFGRRWLQVAGCALLVTAGSWFMFPRSFIYFGVLHGIAVMLLLVRLSAPWGRWLWPAGAAAVALFFASPWLHAAGWLGEGFNAPGLNWIGLVSRKPITEDYVPLLPWLGVMWWGMAAGQWLLAHRSHWLSGPAPAALAWLGRWSLSWYMLHQPMLIGALVLVGWVLR